MRPILALCLASSVAFADYPSKSALLMLQEDMTMDAVRIHLGQPDEVESGMCGQQSKGGAWQCRTWRYLGPNGTGGTRALDVRFRKVRDAWLVNSWSSV